MRKKLKLLASLSTFCMAIAVLCFGVFAAIKVTYTISGSISYDVNDAYVKINTTVYASTKVLTQEQVEQYTLDFVTTDPTTVEGITLVNDNVEEYNSTSATTEPATGEVETGNLSGGSTYFFKVNIQNLSTNEVSASAKAESEMTIPTNMYQFNSGAVTEITTEGKNIVIALSVENPAQALDEEAYNIGVNVNAGDEQTLSQLSLTPITETTEATYNVQNSTAPVSGYSVSATDTDIQGLDGVLNIPTYVDGLPILQVEERAFANCTNLTHILIPTTVQEMGAQCFAGCAGLTELTLPFVGRVNYTSQANVTEQEGDYYMNATISYLFDDVEFDGGIYCGVDISDDVYTVVEWYMPENFATLNILYGCNIISEYAFYESECDGVPLINLCLPNTIKSIGNSAFSCCYSLEEIIIPSSIECIGCYAFYNTAWLENLEINANGLKIVEASDNANVKYLMGADDDSLPADGIITKDMLTGVILICNDVFNGCDNLTGITIPNSVTSIGEWAFNGCDNLEEITILSSVIIIEEKAFSGCQLTNVICNIQGTDYSLVNGKLTIKNMRLDGDTEYPEWYNDNISQLVTSVEFPENCTEINYIFSDYNSLREIYIPKNVEVIEEDVFSSCGKLEKVTICGEEKIEFKSNVFNNSIKIAFSEDTVNICDSVLEGADFITTIEIPSTVETIGERAFANTLITELTIPASVTEIGAECFAGCANLKELTIPFVGQKNYASQAEVENDGDGLNATIYHFFDDVEFDGGILCGANIGGVIVERYISDIESINILFGCLIIANHCFEEGAHTGFPLTNITLPNTIVEIGDYAFYGCDQLKKLIIPESVKKIGEKAFSLYGDRLVEISFLHTSGTIEIKDNFVSTNDVSGSIIKFADNVTWTNAEDSTEVYSNLNKPTLLNDLKNKTWIVTTA